MQVQELVIKMELWEKPYILGSGEIYGGTLVGSILA